MSPKKNLNDLNFIDAIGNNHARATNPRIVSLVPSVTELLFDLDLEANLLGRTAFCIHPKGRVKNIKSVGGTKQINMTKLRALEATHVIVNIDENPKEMVEEIAAMGIEIVVTHPETPEDNIDLFNMLGGIFDREAEAEALCAPLNQALGEIHALRKSRPENRVLYLIWKDPWMIVSQDTYAAQMLALINWQTVGHDPDIRYPRIDDMSQLVADSDRILFSSEPFPFTEDHMEEFRKEFPCDGKHLQLVDGEMITWYGSRAIEAIRYMGELA